MNMEYGEFNVSLKGGIRLPLLFLKMKIYFIKLSWNLIKGKGGFY